MEICNNLSQTTTKSTTNVAHRALFINSMPISTTTIIIIIIMTCYNGCSPLGVVFYWLFRNYVQVQGPVSWARGWEKIVDACKIETVFCWEISAPQMWFLGHSKLSHIPQFLWPHICGKMDLNCFFFMMNFGSQMWSVEVQGILHMVTQRFCSVYEGK